MLHCSMSCLATMSVPAACRVMGFAQPPRNKAVLRQRFVQLVQQRHPDQNRQQDSAHATQAMVQLTEAYASLRRLVEEKTNRADGPPQGRHSAASAHAHEEMYCAEEFRAPGASLSMRAMHLPWQRTTYRTHTAPATSALAARLRRPEAVDEMTLPRFIAAVRALRRWERREEARRGRDDAWAAGSHGYTAAYFASLRAKHTRPSRGGANEAWLYDGGTSAAAIAAHYYRRKLQRLPRKAWQAMMYILLSP